MSAIRRVAAGAALTGLGAFALFGAWMTANSIQDTVSTNAATAVRRAGLPDVQVRADGRRVNVDGPAYQVTPAVAVVEGVEGVEAVNTSLTAAGDAADNGTTAPIAFADTSTVLTEPAQARVESVAAHLATTPNTHVVLTAYAPSGTANALRLGRDRVVAVSTALQTAGVDVTRIDTATAGDLVAAAADLPEHRVEITYEER